MATLGQKGRRPREAALNGQHWLQLRAADGYLNIVAFDPFRVHRVGEAILGRAEIYGRTYHVRCMERVPAWRICDAAGNWDTKVTFAELNGVFQQGEEWQLKVEANSAAPHCWEEIDERRSEEGHKRAW